jgi:uncharacterized protein YndB with AHSA1/START domain
MEKVKITVQAIVNATLDKVWKLWTTPEDITNWNFASEEWCSPKAENDLRAGGSFNYRMEARDGSFGFDFSGKYTQVNQNELIKYTLDDDRKVSVTFKSKGNQTEISETFEAESENPTELQQAGWQMILDNFKKYAEK